MKRNGKIELLRFIASIFVLMFHFDKYILQLPPKTYRDGLAFSFFSHGSIGVEFFFLVSGYLMAKTAYKRISALQSPLCGKTYSSECLGFMKRKYTSIFPYHLAAFVFATVTFFIKERASLAFCIKNIFTSIPSLFLVQMSGIRLTEPNHVEWYISAMLIGMAILYPICLKYYHTFTRYYAPLLSILMIGYMQATRHRLTGVSIWNGVAFHSVFRAIAEIALGATAFEIARYLSSVKWRKLYRYAFALLEFFCFFVFFGYAFLYENFKYEVIILIFLFVLVTVAFSGVSAGAGLFDNKFMYYLGSLSLPIYLSNLPVVYCTSRYFMAYDTGKKLIIMVALAIAFTFAIRICGNLLKRLANVIKNSQKIAGDNAA